MQISTDVIGFEKYRNDSNKCPYLINPPSSFLWEKGGQLPSQMALGHLTNFLHISQILSHK